MVRKAWEYLVFGFDWITRVIGPKFVAFYMVVMPIIIIVFGIFYTVYYVALGNIGKSAFSLLVAILGFFAIWTFWDDVKKIWRFRP